MAPELLSPAATLPAAPAPASVDGVASTDPVSLPQYVPPDISESGIAIAVSGTKYSPGQSIATSSQAAPELTGATAYLLASDPAGNVMVVARGTVGQGGRFILSYQPNGPARLITAVAQLGVTTTEPFTFDNVVARSEIVTVHPQ